MSLPSTPKAAPLALAASEGPQTPGRWRHPQLAEIVRRQAATTFDEKNVTKLVWNVSAFILMWLFGNTLKS
jgi:nucleoporin POM34